MRLFVTRHGESEANCSDLVSGMKDVELTENGIEQAKELAKKLRGKGIDLIYASPRKRARITAELANEFIGARIVIDDRLVEENFGIYEGTSRSAPEFRAMRNSIARKFPKGESTCRVIQRVFNFLDEVKAEHPDKTVLLVSHGITCKIINAYCLDLTDEQFHGFRMGNCALWEYEVE